MRCLLQKDKRGISVMIGYVLLIVLAIGIAAAVWSFLNFYLPKERSQCPNDVSLAVSGVECLDGKITMTLENRGLFSIDGAYVKIGDSGRIVKETLCFEGSGEGNCNIYFLGETTTDGRSILDKGLQPGEKFTKIFDYVGTDGNPITGEQELELEPVVIVDNDFSAICQKALVSRTVNCA